MNSTAVKLQMTNALQWAATGSKLTYVSISVGVLIALVLFKVFFKDLAGFIHSIAFSLGSNSNGAGQAGQSQSKWSRAKLFVILVVPAGCGYLAHMFLPTLFPTVFQ